MTQQTDPPTLTLLELKQPTPLSSRLWRSFLMLATVLILVWAWNASEIRPKTVIDNWDQASGFVFGQELTPNQIATQRRAAESIVYKFAASEAFETSADANGVTAPWETWSNANTQVIQWPAWLIEATEARIAELGDEHTRRLEREFDRQIDGAIGGFFPPETSPDALFGEIRYLDEDSVWRDIAEAAPGPLEQPLLRIGTTVSGEGYVGQLIETLAIAIWGTVIAFAFALPMSILGAHRSVRLFVTGNNLVARWLRGLIVIITRRTFDITRGFNEVVLALILVALFELGPMPGMAALAIHTYGVLGKVFSEAIAAAQEGPIEGAKSTGAGPIQVVSYAIMPQIMPFVVSQTLLRFESNVRSAAILGVVGAGGIGQVLDEKVRSYAFGEVTTILILLILVVVLIDNACSRIMKKFI